MYESSRLRRRISCGWLTHEIQCSVRCAHDSKANGGWLRPCTRFCRAVYGRVFESGMLRPRPRVTSLCSCKEKSPRESTPRMAQRLPRLRGFGSRAAPTRHPVAAGQAQTSLSAPLRALAQSLAGLGRAIRGFENTFERRPEVGCSHPVGASRAPQRDQGFSRASWSSPRRVVCARRVRRAPDRARRAGDRTKSGEATGCLSLW